MSETTEDPELEGVPPQSHDEDQGMAGVVKRNAPLLLASFVVHVFIFMIIALIPTADATIAEEPKTVVQRIQEPEKELEEPPEIEEIVVEPIKVEVQSEVQQEAEQESEEVDQVDEVEDALPNEADVEPDVVSDVVSQNMVANAPPSLMALTGGGASGGGGLPAGYGGRSGTGKKRGRGKFGGGGTADAVNNALWWLYHHQEAEGCWDPTKYQGSGAKDGKEGTTGLATLAFLGEGFSENVGSKEFTQCVRKAIRWINDWVSASPNGHLGENYGSGIFLQVLSEASIFGSSATTKANASKIASFLISVQEAGGGFSYGARPSSRQDLSVSGWIALGLKSAKAAGIPELKTPEAHTLFDKYKSFVELMTTPAAGANAYDYGEALYAKSKFEGEGKTRASMIPVAMFQKQFLGYPRTDTWLTNAAANMQTSTIKCIEGAPIDAYVVYYGTLASFQQGGALWAAWNEKMKVSLTSSQKTGDPRDMGGSWDPDNSKVPQYTGRPGITALYAMCLQVYYRYEKM